VEIHIVKIQWLDQLLVLKRLITKLGIGKAL